MLLHSGFKAAGHERCLFLPQKRVRLLPIRISLCFNTRATMPGSLLMSIAAVRAAGVSPSLVRKLGALCMGAALVLGAVGPLVFLVLGQRYSIAPEVAGASSFGLAALGMIAGSLLSPAPAKTAATR